MRAPQVTIRRSSHIFYSGSYDLSSGKVTSFNKQVSKIHQNQKNRPVCEPLKLLSGGPPTFFNQGPMTYHQVKLQAFISKFQKFNFSPKFRQKTAPCVSPSSYYQVALSHFLLKVPWPIIRSSYKL